MSALNRRSFFSAGLLLPATSLAIVRPKRKQQNDQTLGANYFVRAFNERASKTLKHLVYEAKPFLALLTGSSGNGKTFLLDTLQSQLLSSRKSVRRVSAVTLKTDLVSASESGCLVRFREEITQNDIVMIDDVTYCNVGDSLQRELLLILDSVISNGGGVIVSLNEFAKLNGSPLVGEYRSFRPIHIDLSIQNDLRDYADWKAAKLGLSSYPEKTFRNMRHVDTVLAITNALVRA